MILGSAIRMPTPGSRSSPVFRFGRSERKWERPREYLRRSVRRRSLPSIDMTDGRPLSALIAISARGGLSNRRSALHARPGLGMGATGAIPSLVAPQHPTLAHGNCVSRQRSIAGRAGSGGDALETRSALPVVCPPAFSAWRFPACCRRVLPRGQVITDEMGRLGDDG